MYLTKPTTNVHRHSDAKSNTPTPLNNPAFSEKLQPPKNKTSIYTQGEDVLHFSEHHCRRH